jgi:branched-chain amino acid transport system substrate-binding protein
VVHRKIARKKLQVGVRNAASIEGGRQMFGMRKKRAALQAMGLATVVGDFAFGSDGEWAKSRTFFTQFQNVAPNDVEQFRDGVKQVILWPPEFKTGDMIYPYAKARTQ